MTEDLLTRIQRETNERLRQLRDAVDEHDRLQGELSVLDSAPEIVPEPTHDPEPPANVVRLPVRPQLSRTRMVSPKVARLMRVPRRPALERAGVVRVGAGRFDSLTDEMVDEIDAEAEVYERAI
jgi:hypothetical protein